MSASKKVWEIRSYLLILFIIIQFINPKGHFEFAWHFGLGVFFIGDSVYQKYIQAEMWAEIALNATGDEFIKYKKRLDSFLKIELLIGFILSLGSVVNLFIKIPKLSSLITNPSIEVGSFGVILGILYLFNAKKFVSMKKDEWFGCVWAHRIYGLIVILISIYIGLR